jgi:hypothetical protein
LNDVFYLLNVLWISVDASVSFVSEGSHFNPLIQIEQRQSSVLGTLNIM